MDCCKRWYSQVTDGMELGLMVTQTLADVVCFVFKSRSSTWWLRCISRGAQTRPGALYACLPPSGMPRILFSRFSVGSPLRWFRSRWSFYDGYLVTRIWCRRYPGANNVRLAGQVFRGFYYRTSTLGLVSWIWLRIRTGFRLSSKLPRWFCCF